jgi:hypothetical protein
MSGQDQNYSRQANSTRNKDRDIGIPQMYYCHNVVPTDAGISSIGYLQLAAPPADTDNTFNDTFTLRDDSDNVAIFNSTTSGRNYVLPSVGSGWLRTTDAAPAAGYEVSVAHVNGVSYIFFGKSGCYTYNFGTNTLDPVTLTGLAPANIIGICASSGYLVAWTGNTVFWSSNIDPTDFTPSLVTGAGSQGVQESKGTIVTCLPQNNGFIVYTKKNAVAAQFTNNAQFPFSFREVIGAGGLSSASLVAYDGNSTNHYAYTTAGLQEISMQNSSVIFPQVTDFLAGSQFEDFDETTNLFTQVTLGSPMRKKITLIGNRYLILSYGISTLTHALLYDFALARWGKLKIDHADCFDFTYPSSVVIETPRRSVAMVQANGTVYATVMAYDTSISYGVVVLGKYQMDRNRFITMQEAHLESIRANSTITVSWLTTLDGVNATPSAAVLATSVGTYRRYHSNISGINHSLVVSGGFNLHSLELKFTDGGAVR